MLARLVFFHYENQRRQFWLVEAAKAAAAGKIDLRLADEACRRMDRSREEIRKRTGELTSPSISFAKRVKDEIHP